MMKSTIEYPEKETNEIIAYFMGYIYKETALIDESECGGIYTDRMIYSKIPISITKYPENEHYLNDDFWKNDHFLKSIIGNLDYNLSWDSLIPVIKRCYVIYDEIVLHSLIDEGYTSKNKIKEYTKKIEVIKKSFDKLDISITYNACVEFIKIVIL